MNKITFFDNKNTNLVFSFLFIFFFVFSLALSRSVSDIIVVCISVFFLIKKKEYSFLNIKLYLWIFIFWLYLIVNSLISYISLESLKSTLPYVRFLFFIIFLNLFFRNKKFKYYLLVAFLSLYLILLIDTLIDVSKNMSTIHYRPKSLLGSNLILGSFISKTFAIIIYLIFDLNLNKKYFFYFLVIIVSGVLIYLSSERAALFCFVVITFCSFFFLQKKNFSILIGLFALFFFIMIFFFPNPIKRIYNHTLNQIYENDKFNFHSFRHELHYITAYNIFNSNKMFGSGVKSFRYLCDQDRYSVSNYINDNKKTLAPFDGFFFLSNNTGSKYEFIYFIANDFFKELNIDSNISFSEKISFLDNLFSSPHFILNNETVLITKFTKDNYFNDFGNRNGEFVEKGRDLFVVYDFKNGCNTHPHNFYIQAFAEIGVIGAAFLIFFYIFCVVNFLKCLKDRFFLNRNKEFILYANYVIILFPFLPNGNFFNNYLSLLIYLPLAFINLWTTKSRF